MTIDENAALVPLAVGPEQGPTDALRQVYAAIPGEVVTECEQHRIAASADYLHHMQAVHDALAPYGRFKEWCEAQGINYKRLLNQFDYLANSKQRKLNVSPLRLVPTPSGASGASETLEAPRTRRVLVQSDVPEPKPPRRITVETTIGSPRMPQYVYGPPENEGGGSDDMPWLLVQNWGRAARQLYEIAPSLCRDAALRAMVSPDSSSEHTNRLHELQKCRTSALDIVAAIDAVLGALEHNVVDADGVDGAE